MKRAGFITGYYCVRVSSGNTGWAFFKELRRARNRAAAEGHRSVGYMTCADAGHFIDRKAEVHV